jgi:DNA-binding NarL/FixJ family response regulator
MSPPDSSTPRIRIFVVEDYPVVREGLVQWLNHQPDMEVCGEAGSLTEARALLPESGADVLLLDLMVNGHDGIDFVREIRASQSHLSILVLSMHDESVYAERVMRHGANGYIMKQSSTSELITAIKTVCGGEIYVSPKVSLQLVKRMLQPSRDAMRLGVEALTDRELHVFQLIGNGLTTRAVAHKLCLSPKTIEAHRENIKNKLGLHTSAELARHAAFWVREQEVGQLQAESADDSPSAKNS